MEEADEAGWPGSVRRRDKTSRERRKLVPVLACDDVKAPVEPVLDCPVPAYPDLSCTVWVGLCFWMGFFVGMAGVGWSLWGTKPAVGSRW